MRFGKWQEVLKEPATAPSRIYASLLSHFARGIVFARTHQLLDAAKEQQQLKDPLPNPQLKEAPAAFNPGIAGSLVAEKILEGVTAEEKNELALYITLLKEAVNKED